MKSGVPITDLDGVRSTQIRYILEGERCPSYPAIIGLFPSVSVCVCVCRVGGHVAQGERGWTQLSNAYCKINTP